MHVISRVQNRWVSQQKLGKLSFLWNKKKKKSPFFPLLESHKYFWDKDL